MDFHLREDGMAGFHSLFHINKQTCRASSGFVWCKPMNLNVRAFHLLSLFLTANALFILGVSEAGTPEQKSAPRCHTCGAPITNVYYEIPGLPGLYCEKCYKTLPHCFFCGRPVRDTQKGKRIVCQECRHEVIQDPEEARHLVLQIRDWLNTRLHLQLPTQTGFQFVTDLAPHVGVSLLGTTRELGAFIHEDGTVQILLLNDMPRATLIETVAHELAHVWQEGRVPKGQRLLIKEGFAQWTAAKVLESLKCDQALRVLQKRDDIYGQGYRIIQAVEARHGIPAVLEYVKTSQ